MHCRANRMIFNLICGLLLFSTPGAAQTLNFTALDAPCAACPGGIARQTIAEGINPAGDIVGTYKDAMNQQHGFLLSNGQYTTIDVPGALATIATGINPAGDIVGRYTAPVGSSPECSAAGSPSCIHGFLYSRGNFSTITFPGHPGSFAQRITPDGSIYGCLHDFDLMGSMIGAAWTRFGDVSLMMGGGELADRGMSVMASMNNGATPGGNTIVGFFTDMMANRVHGFVVQNGDFQMYDIPGSMLTQIWDINPELQFVGTFLDNMGKRHGFLQRLDGSSPETIDVPNTAPFHASPSTIVFGINPGGAIVGQYTDTSGHTHGFFALPSDSQ
jgi:probable HAF family extracellular repeat protein